MSQACSPNQRRTASASRSGKRCTWASTIMVRLYRIAARMQPRRSGRDASGRGALPAEDGADAAEEVDRLALDGGPGVLGARALEPPAAARNPPRELLGQLGVVVEQPREGLPIHLEQRRIGDRHD